MSAEPNIEAPQAPTRPADIGRWLFWGPFRNLLNPKRPMSIAKMYGLWRLQYKTAGSNRELMSDELRRCFGEQYTADQYEDLVRNAYRCAWRVHLEELLIGKVGPDSVDKWIEFDGIENLDNALSKGKGVVWVYPHAGAVMMMMAWLSHHGYAYTQYAARGLAPAEIAAEHPELLASNRWRERVREIREANEDRLPAKFLTHHDSARELYRRLAANELVGIAYDGRIGRRWAPFDYLGRTALLNTGPYRLAASTGAAIVPVFCSTPVGKPARCQVGTPVHVEKKDWKSAATQVLATQQQWIQAHPEEYGIWLLHARHRRNIDDHPLFIDHAEDDRWKRWVPSEKMGA